MLLHVAINPYLTSLLKNVMADIDIQLKTGRQSASPSDSVCNLIREISSTVVSPWWFLWAI